MSSLSHSLRIAGLAGSLFFSAFGNSLVSAQGAAPAPAATAPEKTSGFQDSPELENMMVSFRVGKYEEAVEKANEGIAKLGRPEPNLVYWRAYSEDQLGWLDAAEKDYASLGDFVAWPKYPPASEVAEKIQKILDLRPPHMQEIRVDGVVAFRVYYNEESPFTRSVVQSLPASYKAASTIFKNHISEVPVYLFNSAEYDQFVKFFTLLHTAPHSWWRILSAHGGITCSESDVDGNLLNKTVASYSRSFAHELTHVNFQRMVGRVPDFPNWFNEGAAQLVETKLQPSMLEENDRRIQQLFQQNAIVPLDEMAGHDSFHEAVDGAKAGQQKGDPYAQGLNMTRYLGFVMKGIKLPDFLQQVQQKKSFEAALKDNTGMDFKEFYVDWFKKVGGTG